MTTNINHEYARAYLTGELEAPRRYSEQEVRAMTRNYRIGLAKLWIAEDNPKGNDMTNADTETTVALDSVAVDLVPTWAAAAQIFIMCLEAGTPEGQRNAKIEITNMAKALDAANNKLRAMQAALEA